MSAGEFVATRYQSDAGDIFTGRCQQETIDLTIDGTSNAPPAGAATAPVSIRLSAGNTEIGVIPRKVGLKFTATLPTGYAPGQIYYIPIFTPAAYAAMTLNATGTYLGQAVQVVVRIGEISR